MQQIPLDDEVLALLARHGRFGENYNDVARRVLGLTPPDMPAAVPIAARSGRSVAALMHAGLLTAGQSLYWSRPRKGLAYEITVAANGRLVTSDGVSWSTPNSAAAACCGYPAKGWDCWATGEGTTLGELVRIERTIRCQPGDDPSRTST